MRRYCLRLALLSLTALGPVAVYGGDQQIAQQIVEKLQAEKKAGTLKGFSIDLQVDEGTVWLSGRVASEQQQARALDMARRVPGVKQVVNDLTINAPAKEAVVAKPAGGSLITSFLPIQSSKPVAPPAQTAAVPSVSIQATPIETPRSIPATPIEPVYEPIVAAEVELPPTPVAPPSAAPQVAVEARPVAVEAKPLAIETRPLPRVEEFVPAPAAPLPVEQQMVANQQPARKPSLPERRAQSSVLNNVSKTLMSAVHGKSYTEEPRALQPVSATQDVANAIGAAPIGSGVDAGASSRRGSVVQAAQPVQGLAPAESLQPLPAGGPYPQMTAMMPMAMPYMVPVYGPRPQVPLAIAPASSTSPIGYGPGGPGPGGPGGAMGAPQPMYMPGSGVGIAPARYDHPCMPGYAWPSYAAYPNYAAVTYPKQYSPTAWPYIGPFYPYPQVPLGWRKVTMEWDDGWWFLDFKDRRTMYNH
jgi:hypothetical protein